MNATQNPGRRVLAVIRLSRETEETTSPETQRGQIEQWASIHGHRIIGRAEDLDVSGDVHPRERKGLGPWLTERQAEWDVVCASKVDRLSRSLLHFAELLGWADDSNKTVATVTDSIDTSTPTGLLLAQILATFAEYERQRITTRIKELKLTLAEGRPARWRTSAVLAPVGAG